MKSQKGVTLVALVVTIIVLIILAGISINLILGDNGIITIAKRSKENTELAKIQEETELNKLYEQLEIEGFNSDNLQYDSIAKLTKFKTAIANAIDEAGGIKPEVSAETSVFENNIKGILKEVTKDATATVDKILKGETAYVNGELVIGTYEDNTSDYDKGYEDGKGYAKEHADVCTITRKYGSQDSQGSDWRKYKYTDTHNKCGVAATMGTEFFSLSQTSTPSAKMSYHAYIKEE